MGGVQDVGLFLIKVIEGMVDMETGYSKVVEA